MSATDVLAAPYHRLAVAPGPRPVDGTRRHGSDSEAPLERQRGGTTAEVPGHDVGAGTLHLVRERVDLVEVAWETTSDMADVMLRWHPTEVHAPAAIVIDADPTAVREILSNLLSNAAKFSPRGSYIDVAVGQCHDDAQVTVRDRGCGLTTADAERVFDRYLQVDPHGPGVGLGLYVSRSLARAHGGELEVRPATARGSEFRLILPNAAVG